MAREIQVGGGGGSEPKNSYSEVTFRVTFSLIDMF